MPFDVQWHDSEHTMMLISAYDEVTWDLWYDLLDRFCKELEKTPHRVDFIFYDTSGFPKGNPIPHIRHTIMTMKAYSNFGLFVQVSNRNLFFLMKTMAELVMSISNITNKRVAYFAETIEKAVEIIQKDRASNSSQK